MNKIDFQLACDDRLTPALLLATNALSKFKNGAKDVNGYLDGLGKSAGSMDALQGRLAGVGSALMSLGTGAILGGIAATTAAVFGLSRSIQAAGKEETQTLMTVSDIASGLGVGFTETQKRVDNLKESIADMAAPLPGTTETYVAGLKPYLRY